MWLGMDVDKPREVKCGETYWLLGLRDCQNPITFGKVIDGVQTSVTADGCFTIPQSINPLTFENIIKVCGFPTKDRNPYTLEPLDYE